MHTDESSLESSLATTTITDPLLKAVPFGRPMRDAHFLLDPKYNPLNHGSYGTHPKFVRERFRACQDLSEARPDAFQRNHGPKMLDSSRVALASFLGVPVDEIVLVPNATTGFNIVLRNIKFKPGDVIIHLSTAYGAVAKTVEYMIETTPVDSIVVEVKYPISDDDLLEKFQSGIRAATNAGKQVRVGLFDTISSMPGVKVPWERLVELCKAEGVLSLVDGAHSVGQIQVNLDKIQPDFFVSNLHKWLYVPRTCAVFYIPLRNQHIIRSSLPTSHGYVPVPRKSTQGLIHNPLQASNKSPFVLLFEFVATLDISPYLCVEAALKFRQDACGGEEKIMQYCRDLANKAAKDAAERFGTEVLDNPEGSLTKCAMVNVRLPLKVGTSQGEIRSGDQLQVCQWMASKLLSDYDTYASIWYQGESIYVRFSGQIYVEIGDFSWGIKSLQDLCKRIAVGEYLHVDVQK